MLESTFSSVFGTAESLVASGVGRRTSCCAAPLLGGAGRSLRWCRTCSGTAYSKNFVVTLALAAAHRADGHHAGEREPGRGHRGHGRVQPRAVPLHPRLGAKDIGSAFLAMAVGLGHGHGLHCAGGACSPSSWRVVNVAVRAVALRQAAANRARRCGSPFRRTWSTTACSTKCSARYADEHRSSTEVTDHQHGQPVPADLRSCVCASAGLEKAHDRRAAVPERELEDSSWG